MSSRAKLSLGLGIIAAFVLLLVALRDQQPTTKPEPTHSKPASTPAHERSSSRHLSAQSSGSSPTDPSDEDLEQSRPVAELRDHTGELLSDGPAKQVTLPERPPGAEENTPSPIETQTTLESVIARLDTEIAAARAAGDAAEAARLQVRRERLTDKLETRAPDP